MRVRGSIRVLAAAILVAVASPAAADIQKIGYVDSARIFEQYKTAQEAQKDFDHQVATWNQDLADLKNQIADLRKELETQGLVLGDAKRREKESQLSHKQSDYQNRVDQIWGPTGQATQRNQELVKNVMDKVRKVLETIAQKGGYTFVLDGASGRILYGSKDYDLTQDVIDQLNTEATAAGSSTVTH